MKETMGIIINLLKDYYYGNEVFVYIALGCLLYLLAFEKEVRKKFVIPMLLIAIVVLNPLLYQYVFFKVYMYWRFFWIFSLHLIIGTTIICLLKRIKYDFLKIFIFVIPCFLIISFGNNSFESDAFEKTISLEKLPYGVVEVCEKMLELEQEPLVVSDLRFSTYARQYSGKIKQLWGRNADGYISDIEKMTFEYFKMFHRSGDFNTVLTYAAQKGYNFAVTEDDREIDLETQLATGFEEVFSKGEYRLYHYVGTQE